MLIVVCSSVDGVLHWIWNSSWTPQRLHKPIHSTQIKPFCKKKKEKKRL